MRDAASPSSQPAPTSIADEHDDKDLDKRIETSVKTSIDLIMNMMDEETKYIKDMQKKLFDTLSQDPADIIETEQPRHIVGCSGEGQYHWVAPFGNANLETWTTKCGWRYAFSNFDRCWSVPGEIHFEKICKRCLPELRRQREEEWRKKAVAVESSSASSSSSSSSGTDMA